MYWFWFGTLGLGLCNLVMVVRKGLLRRLPWLGGFLLVSSGLGSVWWLLAPHLSAREYGLAYIVHQGALLIVTMMLLYSLWEAGFVKYRGLYRLCAATLILTVVGSLLVVLVTTGSGSGAAPTPAYWIIQWVYLFVRSAMFVAVGLLWAFFGLLALFRVQIGQTIRNLAVGLFFFASAHVILDSWSYLWPASNGLTLSYVKLTATLIFESIWFAAIVRDRADESVETAPALALQASPEDLERQMDAINLALLRLTGSSPR